MILELPQLSSMINGFTGTLFRLELLDTYTSASDGGDVDRYLRGEPEPDPGRKGPWLSRLRSERGEGRQRQRVHVLRSPISPYCRYECEWGYVMNAEAGEDIRILDLSERPLPPPLAGISQDFWLIDDATAALMTYDSIGRFVKAETAAPAEIPLYLAARDAAMAAAEPFASWWQRHPEFHQANQGNQAA